MVSAYPDDSDPLSVFTRAPANETPGERAARESAEAEAKRRSDAIDDELRREKARLKKDEKGIVKVLLLGQSESGKSTTLKNFRMKYARSEWEAELSTWRTVIQLNLLRSVILILDTLQAEQDNVPTDSDADPSQPHHLGHSATSVASQSSQSNLGHSSAGPTGYSPSGTIGRSRGGSISSPSNGQTQPPAFRSLNINTGVSSRRDVFAASNGAQNQPVSPTPSYTSSSSPTITSATYGPSRSRAPSMSTNPPRDPNAPQLTGKHQLLKLRLAPLRRVDQDLRRRLGAGAEEEDMDAAVPAGLMGAAESEYGPLGNITNGILRRKATREFGVRRLKDALDNSFHSQSNSPVSAGSGRSNHGHSGADEKARRRKDTKGSNEGVDGSWQAGREVDEATEVIASCADDIKALWADEVVKSVLKRRKIRLEDTAGFFLDDLDRIAQRTYTPSSDDVVRARLRTLGVQEYKVKFEPQTGKGSISNSIINFGNEWLLYDVGGSRTGRNAWIPYFEGVHAIIFLAPLSCFDERLLEDSRINRLEDSFLLWRSVCSSRLLRKASLILFMNKCDLLRRKLKAGVKVKNYLPSYGDRPNDANTVVRYLKDKFKDIAKSSPEQGGRVTYYYATSVTDTKTTGLTLVAVKDIILREHLKNADFV